MMNRFYANEPMTKLNLGFFAFASYNAGPGRIAPMRRLAAKRGLDQNVWFNNVEVVASGKIGRETIQYVSNIYKYDLAYQIDRGTARRARISQRGGEEWGGELMVIPMTSLFLASVWTPHPIRSRPGADGGM